MASIDCVVDTRPMAKEIDSVAKRVDGTTAAVVGMKMAIIAAQSDATKKVCNDVNRGFYTLIQSQISQKVAKLQSDVDSHAIKLTQLSKQLKGLQYRMGRDYQMLVKRYDKLFTGLNKNLRQRVYELDKPAVDFAERDVEQVNNRSRMLTATVPVSQLESLKDSQEILVSDMKYSGQKVIHSISRFLNDMRTLKLTTDRILLHERTDRDNTQLTIPVVICESNYDRNDNRRTQVYMNDGLTSGTQSAISNRLYSDFERLPWSGGAEADRELKSEFSKLVDSSDMSQRTRELTQKLFMGNKFDTL